jgi:phosphatidylglycerophosphate synthase
MSGGLLLFDDSAEGAALARRRFGGLTNVERGVRTMVRAGVDRLLVVLPEGVEPSFGKVTRRLSVELELCRWGETPSTRFDDGDSVLLCLGDHTHHHTSLTALRDAGRRRHPAVAQVTEAPDQSLPFLCVSGSGRFDWTEAPTRPVSTGAFLVDGGLPLVEMVPARQAPLSWLAEHLAVDDIEERAGDVALWRRVVDGCSARQAKAMLFGQVTKKTSGPVSRHINARLSIPISKVLIETGISPHMVTVLFVLTTGLTTAWLISNPVPYSRLALAGLFWQMAAVLDRCDGEIARVKLCESKFGAWFDTLTDNIAYLATYVAFLFGIQVLHPDKPWALYAGISAIGAMVVALGIMYNYALKTGSGSLQNYLVGFRSHVRDEDKNSIYRWLERYAFIAKRDFFAFVHFLCCILGSFEALYIYTVGGLHLIVLAVLISQRKMLEGHRRLSGEPGPANVPPEASPR